jgi:hypothetical protein
LNLLSPFYILGRLERVDFDSDRCGLPRLGAYEPHRRYATEEAAQGYARAEQEALAVAGES